MCYEHATSQHDFDYSFYDYICECSRWRSRHDRQHKVGECHHCPSYIDSLISWWMVLTFKIRLARSLMLSCFKNNAPCMSTQTMSPAHVSAMLSVMSDAYGVSPSMPIVASPPIGCEKWFAEVHNIMTLKLNLRRVTTQHEIDHVACVLWTRYISAWWSM